MSLSSSVSHYEGQEPYFHGQLPPPPQMYDYLDLPSLGKIEAFEARHEELRPHRDIYIFNGSDLDVMLLSQIRTKVDGVLQKNGLLEYMKGANNRAASLDQLRKVLAVEKDIRGLEKELKKLKSCWQWFLIIFLLDITNAHLIKRNKKSVIK